MKIQRRVSNSRRLSNLWLSRHCINITGDILSIGSAQDLDGEGRRYIDYFPKASSYTTSEYPDQGTCDLLLDVTDMSGIRDAAYDCIYCSGVLEHVFDFRKGMEEITRILKPEGVLLLGLPFNQGIHMAPQDYWRFTRHGIEMLLKENYAIIEIEEIDGIVNRHPATYWTKAIKKQSGT